MPQSNHTTSRHIGLIALLVVFLLSLSASAVRADNITYQFVSPADPYSVTGSVTTDGHIGALTSADIVSWSWTIANATDSASATSYDTDALASTINLMATSDVLYLNYPDPDAQNSITFSATGTDAGGDAISNVLTYFTNYQPAIEPEPFANTIQGISVQMQSGLYNVAFQQSTSYSYLPSSPFVIASVATPEPATLTLLALGALPLLRRKPN